MKRGPRISTSIIPNHPKQVPSIFHSDKLIYLSNGKKGKDKVHPCTGTEALYRPYGP